MNDERIEVNENAGRDGNNDRDRDNGGTGTATGSDSDSDRRISTTGGGGDLSRAEPVGDSGAEIGGDVSGDSGVDSGSPGPENQPGADDGSGSGSGSGEPVKRRRRRRTSAGGTGTGTGEETPSVPKMDFGPLGEEEEDVPDFIKNLGLGGGEESSGKGGVRPTTLYAQMWSMLYNMPSQAGMGKWWELTKGEALELAKATDILLKSLPASQKRKFEKQLKQWMPLLGFAYTVTVLTYPRIRLTMQELKENVRSQPGSSEGDNTGIGENGRAARTTYWNYPFSGHTRVE